MKTEKRPGLVNAESANTPDVTPSAADETGLKPEPTHEEIAVVAKQIYDEAGRPSGHAEMHWEAAESHLRRETFNGI